MRKSIANEQRAVVDGEANAMSAKDQWFSWTASCRAARGFGFGPSDPMVVALSPIVMSIAGVGLLALGVYVSVGLHGKLSHILANLEPEN